MPFLAPLVAPLLAGGASAAGGAIASGLIGGGGGQKGSGFTAQGVPIQTNNASTDLAAQQAQGGLQQQQALLQALQGQGGIGNQSQVYNQLQGIAAGQGPNPAQAALAQATQANTANQAALMAGQRGAGANAGLLARQAAMQGAANQQNSIGQAATLQAQQSLNALGAAGNLANQQVGQQIGATTGLNQAAQGEQQQLLGQLANQNQLAVQQQGGQNATNAGIAGINAKGQQGAIGGALGGLGSAIGTALAGQPTQAPQNILKPLDTVSTSPTGGPAIAQGQAFGPQLKAHGGMIQGYAQGGHIDPKHSPKSKVGQHLKKVPALVSPGEVYLSPTKAKSVAEGKANPLESGEKIKGKAAVKGDSLKNDTVKKTLTAGGVVIPRSVMESKDPAANAAKFVAAHMSKHGLPKKAAK